MMKQYVIKKRGKEVTSIYGTYDEARSLVRQIIRRRAKAGKLVPNFATVGYMDGTSRNPTKLAGYKIVAV